MNCPHKRPIEILLVEDSPTDRLIAIEALSSARVLNNLNTVQDGIEAMEFLHRDGKYASVARPDLIILDLNLPRMDGRAVLREIKADPRFNMIPVVVMTTSQDEEDVAAAYGLHANCFITKPVAFDAFIQVIRSLETFWFEVVTFPPPVDTRRALERQAQSDTAKIRVLLIEDSPSEALLCRLALEDSVSPVFILTLVASLEGAEQLLSREVFDAIVADLGLPDSQGIATVKRLRDCSPVIPLIVLTGLDDDDLGLSALECGAQDYLCKGSISSRGLVRAVRYAVQRCALERKLALSQRLEATGRLAAGVAHDFNNILTAIGGHVALLAGEANLSEDGQTSVLEIRAAVSRATHFTRQLLSFTQQQGAHCASVCLSTLIGETHRMLTRLLGDSITLELHLATDLPRVNLDKMLFEQVLINLALNARDAMSTGGKLSLGTARVEIVSKAANRKAGAEPSSHVCLSVADTGVGIAQDVLPRVFEPFFTTKNGAPGGGLGLAAVYGIMQQHEGWVDVQSPPGHGTRFDLYLPCLVSQGLVSPALEEDKGLTTLPRGGRECLLIVEDEHAVSNMLKTVLQQHGYRVLLAADSAEALALWKKDADTIDLVVSDFIMPTGLNGIDLVNTLSFQRPGLPSIIVSGYGIDRSDEDDFLVPGENYLQKPYTMVELLALIRHKLDHLTRNQPTLK